MHLGGRGASIYRLGVRNLAQGGANGGRGHGRGELASSSDFLASSRGLEGVTRTQEHQGHEECADGALLREGIASDTGAGRQSAARARLWHANPVRDKILRGQTCPARSPLSGGHSGAEGLDNKCRG